MSLDNYESYEKAIDKGPVSGFLKILALVVFIVVVLGLVGYGLGWFSEAGQVLQEEAGPRGALKKYEYFINTANDIKKMDKDLILHENRLKAVDEQYKGYGKDQAKWPLDVRVQYNHAKEIARDDLLAVASQRNNLVKEYNAASSKFNWAPFRTSPDKPEENLQEYKIP